MNVDRRDMLKGLGAAAATAVAPRLPLGKYAAWVIGPIAKLDFVPDVTMIWGDPFKINWCALVAKSLDAKVITPEFDGIDSCIYEVVNTIEKQDYQIAIPDPGEIVRARTKMTDLTFTIPGAKLPDFIERSMNFNMSFNVAGAYLLYALVQMGLETMPVEALALVGCVSPVVCGGVLLYCWHRESVENAAPASWRNLSGSVKALPWADVGLFVLCALVCSVAELFLAPFDGPSRAFSVVS